MAVAKSQKFAQRLDDGPFHCAGQFVIHVVVAVDVAAHTRAPQQFHVVAPGKQPDVVDLRDAGHEALNRACDEILVIAPAERVIERAVDLVHVHVGRGGAARLTALATTALVNGCDQRMNVAWWKQPRTRPPRVGVHVLHADAVVRIEDGHGIARADPEPSAQVRHVAGVERVQHERRQREVVDPVHLARHVDLILMVSVNLDQHVHAAGMALRGDVGNERERLGNHEAARTGLLDREADGVEPDGPDSRRMKPVQHALEISPPFRVMDIDVNLLAGKGRPQQHVIAVRGPVFRERWMRPRRVQRKQIRFAGTGSEDAVVGEKHAGVR